MTWGKGGSFFAHLWRLSSSFFISDRQWQSQEGSSLGMEQGQEQGATSARDNWGSATSVLLYLNRMSMMDGHGTQITLWG